MAVPKRRNPRARRNSRRANHDRVGAPAVVDCPNCGDLMVPHRICPACGHYNGEEIIKKGGDEDDQE